VDELRNPGPLTIFAPTETAFVRLPPDVYRGLFQPENQELLQEILLYHVVGDSIIELPSGDMNITTVVGLNLTISYKNGRSFVNDLPIYETNISAVNGIIHSIDDLLIPEGLIPRPTGSPTITDAPSNIVNDDPTMATVSQSGAPTAAPADLTNPPTLLDNAAPTMAPPDQTNSPTVQIDDSFVNVTVRIVFDDSPEEIGWLIQDVTDNTIVASQAIGTYSPTVDATEEIIRLQEGIYLFGIEDAAGDGLCCEIPGLVIVSIDGEEAGRIEGNFGSFEFLSFSVP
jgi:hypothetical protein